MPRRVMPLLLILASLALVPFACIAQRRTLRTPETRLHLVGDMDQQQKFKTQSRNALFADGRAMRHQVEGTVARGRLEADDRYYRGLDGDAYVAEFPVELTAELMLRGRERYDIFCAPCHGLAGYGDGMVSQRADELLQGSWVPPASFHDEPAATRSVGHLFNSITNGIRNMPPYGSQVPVADRWAIVAYVSALQRSQRATPEDVPVAERARLGETGEGE
jgi:mono/diheme cytochrome c family protein